MRWVLGIALVCAWIGAIAAQGERERVLDTSEAGMKAISEALGVECAYCHSVQKPDGTPDYKEMTPMKETAIFMHRQFVERLVTLEGAPVTCATCHQGRVRFLPRDTTEAKPSQLAGASRSEITELMKGMQQAMGAAGCDFCHVRRRDGRMDSVMPTPNKVTARFMIDHMAGQFRDKNTGQVTTCVTCHQGKAQFVPRAGR